MQDLYLSRLAVQQFAAAEWWWGNSNECPHDNICQLPSIIIHCQTIESWLSTTTSLAPLFDPALFISFSCHLIKLKAPAATCVFFSEWGCGVGVERERKILFYFFSFPNIIHHHLFHYSSSQSNEFRVVPFSTARSQRQRAVCIPQHTSTNSSTHTNFFSKKLFLFFIFLTSSNNHRASEPPTSAFHFHPSGTRPIRKKELRVSLSHHIT